MTYINIIIITIGLQIYSCTSKYFLKEGNIAENIAFGFTIENLDFESLEKSSRTAQIYKFIKESRWILLVGERGIKLSGGQRQRIAIARAL